MAKHPASDSHAGALPKLCGADIELGNFIVGLEQTQSTGYQASRALLMEISGLPLRHYGYSGSSYDVNGYYSSGYASNSYGGTSSGGNGHGGKGTADSMTVAIAPDGFESVNPASNWQRHRRDCTTRRSST